MDLMDTDPLTSPLVESDDVLLFYLSKAQSYIKKTRDDYLTKKEEAKVRQKELQRLHTLNKHLVEKIQSVLTENKQLKQNCEFRSPTKNKRRKTSSTDRSDSSSPSFNNSVPSSDVENNGNHSSIEELNDNIANMSTVEDTDQVKLEPLSPTTKHNMLVNERHQMHSKSYRKKLDLSSVVIPETEENSITAIRKGWICKAMAKKGKVAFFKPISPKSVTTSSKGKSTCSNLRVPEVNKLMRQKTLMELFSKRAEAPSNKLTETDSNQTFCEDLEVLPPQAKSCRLSKAKTDFLGNSKRTNQSFVHSQLLKTAEKLASESGEDDCSIVEELRLVVKQENLEGDSKKKKVEIIPQILENKMETPDIFSNRSSQDELFKDTESLVFLENTPAMAISINSTLADDSINVLEERVLQQAATPQSELSPVQINPSERIKLKCKECEKTFNFMSLSKSAEEVAQLDTRCYYHKRVLRPPTPEGFWNHLFTETQ